MIAVDTNIIVRLMTRDDEAQFRRARDTFRRSEVFVSDTVMLETAWVLDYAYGLGRDEIVRAIRLLCSQRNVHLSNPALAASVIEWYEGGMDFADAFHLAQSVHCEMLLTFDARFVKKAAGKARCRVSEPPKRGG